ncbi:YggN family protein [Luteimonas aquatica]|uniref:YggN family protein n=1 Tax=Luteimonas aquatica TaxID=450364 RepID=UPI001F5603E6|nr:YggN family protein [Luteimonas aquatica]
MNAATFLLKLLPLAAALALAACGPAPNNGNGTVVKQAIDEAKAGIDEARKGMNEAKSEIAKVRTELATQNLDLDGNGNVAKAQITPEGDLLIAGRRIEVNAQQHALLQEYRRQLQGVASRGAEIGLQGADLGLQAAGEALKGVFSGNTQDIEARIAPQAEKIKAQALKLCDALPALLKAQEQLAAALPEFKPYATMSLTDITDCKNET